jgi:iron complex outermembrane recepter protein
VGGLRYFTETLNGVQEQTHPFGGFPGGVSLTPIPDTTQTFSKTTYKANASYKFNRELLVYVTASEGFRGGGLNAVSEPFEPIPGSFAPDTLWNYELGLKGRLFDGKLDYQVDAYTLFWHNIQIQETTADGAFNYTGNAGDAVVRGFEFEFQVHPLNYLTASFAGSYQDAYLSHGATPAQYAANPTLGLTGDKIPNVAPFQFDLGLNYTRPLSAAWIGTLAADIDYRGATNSYFVSNIYNIPLSAYTLANLRAGVSTGPWTVNLFARNVGNERAQISAINSLQDPEALLTVRPRTIGMNVTRTF